MILLLTFIFSCNGSCVKATFNMIVTIAAGKLERRSRKPFSSPLDLNFFCMAASIVKVKLVYLIDRFRLLRCWSLASYDRNNRSAFYFSDCRVWSNYSMEGRLQWSPVKINSGDYVALGLRTVFYRNSQWLQLLSVAHSSNVSFPELLKKYRTFSVRFLSKYRNTTGSLGRYIGWFHGAVKNITTQLITVRSITEAS